jgi:hypothetical protein
MGDHLPALQGADVQQYQYRYAHTPWWHWPLVPFAAIAAAALAGFLVIALQWAGLALFSGGQATQGWYVERGAPLVLGSISGYFYAWGACRFAPNASRLVGFGLTLILGAVLALKILGAWHDPENAFAEPVRFTLGACAALAGAVFALVTLRD